MLTLLRVVAVAAIGAFCTFSPVDAAPAADSTALCKTMAADRYEPVNGRPLFNLDATALHHAAKPRASALLSHPSDPLRIASIRSGSDQFQVLVRMGERQPQVVVLIATLAGRGKHRKVDWFPAGTAEADLQTLERLYQMVLEQPPDEAFSFQISATRRTWTRLSYNMTLGLIARARECVAQNFVRAQQVTRIRRWEVASLDRPRRPAGKLEAMVRVRDAQGNALAGMQIAFARGEHLGCSAATDATGVASCTLWDPHGHAAHEQEDNRAPVIASFGGLVEPERIVLPTSERFISPHLRLRVSGHSLQSR